MVVRDEGRRSAYIVVMQRIKFLDVFIFDCLKPPGSGTSCLCASVLTCCHSLLMLLSNIICMMFILADPSSAGATSTSPR